MMRIGVTSGTLCAPLSLTLHRGRSTPRGSCTPRRPLELQGELATQGATRRRRRRRTRPAAPNITARTHPLNQHSTARPGQFAAPKNGRSGIPGRALSFNPHLPARMSGRSRAAHAGNDKWPPKSRRPFVLGLVLGTESTSSKNNPVAVPVGFEPTVESPPHNFSRVAPSAARTRYRGRV